MGEGRGKGGGEGVERRKGRGGEENIRGVAQGMELWLGLIRGKMG